MDVLTVKVDGRGRIQLPKGVREQYGIKDRVVLEKHVGALEIKTPKSREDALDFLLSLNFKSDKTPLQMKKEAQKAFLESV